MPLRPMKGSQNIGSPNKNRKPFNAPCIRLCAVAKNNRMRSLLRRYRYYVSKRYSTIAGTLTYFFIMSLAPFLLWLSLLAGNIDWSTILDAQIFEGISPFLNAVRQSAESAAGSAGIVLLLTSLYSSTNFFFHLRRSGEIIYGSRKQKGGLALRIASIALILGSIAFIVFLGIISLAWGWLMGALVPQPVTVLLSVIFGAVVFFLTAVFLNMLACPYKLKFSEAFSGSILTTLLWIISTVGFAVYLRFATPEKLYGAIASVIIFLLWCYLMMCCLVVGMIDNGLYKTSRVYKKRF